MKLIVALTDGSNLEFSVNILKRTIYIAQTVNDYTPSAAIQISFDDITRLKDAIAPYVKMFMK